MLALAAMPMPPCRTEARSVAMSPNIFGRTTTSRSSGSLTSHIVKASMNALVVSMSSNSSSISSNTLLNSLHPRKTLLLSTQVTLWGAFRWLCLRLASSKANLMTLSLPLRVIGRGSHATSSPSRPGNLGVARGSSLAPTAAWAERRRRLWYSPSVFSLMSTMSTRSGSQISVCSPCTLCCTPW